MGPATSGTVGGSPAPHLEIAFTSHWPLEDLVAHRRMGLRMGSREPRCGGGGGSGQGSCVMPT